MSRLAVFDCDGTLVDSQANICRAMEQCFVNAQLAPPDRGVIRRVVGLSLVPAIAMLLPDADADFHRAMAEDYRKAFFAIRSSGGMEEEPLFDGVADAIEALDAAGWQLGVATGKSDRGLHHVLDHHGLLKRFVTLQTADRHPSKPHPSMLQQAMVDAGASPATTAMIGDTSFDMAMARAAGAHAIGVVWGYHTPEELTAAGAHHIVAHARELAELLESL